MLRHCQVFDQGRLSFYVGLKRTKRRHRGLPVYKAKCGTELVILDG